MEFLNDHPEVILFIVVIRVLRMDWKYIIAFWIWTALDKNVFPATGILSLLIFLLACLLYPFLTGRRRLI